jgi:hypothetical protein
MIFSARVRPPGSFLVIAGDMHAPMPEFDNQENRLWANEWCIGIGTLSEIDGETEVIVTDQPRNESFPLVFDSVIEAPEQRVTVSDAYLMETASVNVSSNKARIQIWANHSREPDRIVIAVTADK